MENVGFRPLYIDLSERPSVESREISEGVEFWREVRRRRKARAR